MRTTLLAALFATFVCANAVRAEDKPQAGDEDKKRIAALLKDLGSDEFEVRENAEKGLLAIGAAAVPPVKETAAASADAEVRARCARIVKALALVTETDPEQLAVMAKSEAEAKHYADAAKLYAKAGKFFKDAADKAAEGKAKKELAAKSTKALERQKRAEQIAQMAGGDENAQVFINNGRVRIIRAQAMGGVVINGVAGGGEDGTGDDW